MLPAAVVIGAWLWFSRSRRSALLWLAVLLSVYAAVGASKILFKGWGIGLESLNIAVISGHATNTSLILPVAMSLLAQQVDPRLRWPGAGVGLLIAWWFSINCVAPYIHPLQEAIAGALLGSFAACGFLYCLENTEIKKIPAAALVMGLAFIAFNTTTTKYTAEHLLNRIAVSVSGGETAFKRSEWRPHLETTKL